MRCFRLFHGRWTPSRVLSFAAGTLATVASMAAPICAGTITFGFNGFSTLVMRSKKVALMKSLSILLVVTLAMLAMPAHAVAAVIFTPGDTIFGGVKSGPTFTINNNWPGHEAPSNAIDGVGQKYLNISMINTGFIVNPSIGSSVATSITLWTANDVEGRDPASYELWGSNASIGSGPSFSLSDFTLISSGLLSLPSARNPGGNTPLSDSNSQPIGNSQTIGFTNSTAYTSYMIIFPTLKNYSDGMQIAEVQLYSSAAVPEPSSLVIFGIGAGIAGLKARTRKRVV